MIILGITNNDLSGACLVRDGLILSAVSEERFTRIKDHKVWPTKSIEFVLGQAGLSLEDVNYVAYGWNAGFSADKHLELYFDRIVEEVRNNPQGLAQFRQRITDEVKNDKEKEPSLTNLLPPMI